MKVPGLSNADRVTTLIAPPMALPSISGVRDFSTSRLDTAVDGIASMLSWRLPRSAVAMVPPSKLPMVKLGFRPRIET